MTLEKWLESAGISQRAFAKKIEVSEAYVTLLKQRQRIPGPKMAQKIEQATKGQVNRLDLLYPDD